MSFLSFIMNIAVVWLSLTVILLGRSDGVVFDCNFRMFAYPTYGNLYGCEPEVIIAGNLTNLLAVTGRHIGWRSNNDIKMLDVRNEKEMNQIPKDISTFFPVIQVIFWTKGSLTRLTSNDLEQFPHLSVLSLSGNKIVSLAENVFSHNSGVHEMFLANNQLEYVESDLFSSINHLKRADFSSNSCVDFFAQSPQEMAHLKRLFTDQCNTPQPTTLQPPIYTEPDSCMWRCSLNEETDELNKKLLELIEVVKKLSDKTDELERQVRELNANPGSWSRRKQNVIVFVHSCESIKQLLERITSFPTKTKRS